MSAPGTGPGRLVRLPLGYLWTAAGVGLLSLLLSYALGFSAGVSRTEARLAEEGVRSAAEPGPATDPLRAGANDSATKGSAGGNTGRSGGDGVRAREGSGASETQRRGAGGQQSGDARSGGDPRVPGHYYFVLAHASVEKSRNEMVQFLSDNGLDARVVRDGKGVPRKVIVLPGFPTKDAGSSQELRRMRDRIREVGLKWARQGRGNRDFGDAYLEAYRP